MITEDQVQAALQPHPLFDKMWLAKLAGVSVITGKFANSGDYSLFELKDKEGEVHSHLRMDQLLDILNEKE